MYDKKTVIGDEMIENRLKEKSRKLGISLDELIDRYIRRELYSDDYYIQPQLSREELDRLSKRDWKETLKMEFLLENMILVFSLTVEQIQ